jgi:hypothetical protein
MQRCNALAVPDPEIDGVWLLIYMFSSVLDYLGDRERGVPSALDMNSTSGSI